MPRRNLQCLLVVILVSFLCYHKIPTNRYSRTLADSLDHVSAHYYVPIDDLTLFEGSMKGMMGQLDENSTYIGTAKKRQFNEEITKEFGGIGVSMAEDPKTKHLIVIAPLPGSPAMLAGIRPGDRILRIDGQDAEKLSLADTHEKVRGKPGTSVTLTVQHIGQSKPVDIKMVRQIIQVDTVQGDTRNDDGSWNFWIPGQDHIGYARVTGFAEAETTEGGKSEKTTPADLKKVLDELTAQGMRGLVLDLRDNPGGSLEAAVQVCRLFLSKGQIVTIRGREGKILQSFEATGAAPFAIVPVAILVNQNSASASEIVSACLQDHDRAIVVGQQTFGKGTVQEVIDLGDALGSLKLTIASYWRPSGQNIQRHKNDPNDKNWGVMPNSGYEVIVSDDELTKFYEAENAAELSRLSAEASGKPSENASKPSVDRPLEKALEYFNKADARRPDAA